MNYRQHIENLLQMAHLVGIFDDELLALSGDGSDRKFFRIPLHSGESCLAAFPAQTVSVGAGLAESSSANSIGKHLAQKGVPVPHILAYDAASGAILFEDLGNTLLYDVVEGSSVFPIDLYRQALKHLVTFQVEGKKDFCASYCWDTLVYDRQLMLSRESGYFLQEFCVDLLGLEKNSHRLSVDFEKLADRVGQEDSQFLMHRDFQSRNLMVDNHGGIKIIDFQGARLGPLGYDVASIINDPYVTISPVDKDVLLGYYLDLLGRRIGVDRKDFIRGYYHVALQRNLQVLGAYAFLSQKKHKEFFSSLTEGLPISCSRAANLRNNTS